MSDPVYLLSLGGNPTQEDVELLADCIGDACEDADVPGSDVVVVGKEVEAIEKDELLEALGEK